MQTPNPLTGKRFNYSVNKRPACNSTFAIGGVSCSSDSFVVRGISFLRMNIFAEKPAHRKSANPCVQYNNKTANEQCHQYYDLPIIKTKTNYNKNNGNNYK